MSDVVVVMHQSRIAQVGPPRTLYDAPSNLFVADFLGDSNLLPGRIVAASDAGFLVEVADGARIKVARAAQSLSVGDRAVILIRPEDMSLDGGVTRSDGREALAGTIRDVSYHGDSYRLDIAVGAQTLKVRLARGSGGGVEAGQRVTVSWRSDAARLLPAEDGRDAAEAAP